MSRRVIAVAAAVVVLLGAVWWIGIKNPQSSAIAKARDQQAAAEAQVPTLQSQLNALLKEKAKLPAVQAQLAALKIALPADAALAQVIDDIHQAATATGVNLLSLAQSAPTVSTVAGATTAPAAGGLQQVMLTLSVSGTYEQVTGYVNSLNGLARTMVVDSLTLGSSASAAAMTAAVTGRMFYVKSGG